MITAPGGGHISLILYFGWGDGWTVAKCPPSRVPSELELMARDGVGDQQGMGNLTGKAPRCHTATKPVVIGNEQYKKGGKNLPEPSGTTHPLIVY